MSKNILLLVLVILSYIGLVGCAPSPMSSENLPLPQANSEQLLTAPATLQGNTLAVWNKLQYVPLKNLQTAAIQATDPMVIAWMQLAVISKQYSTDVTQLVNQLIAWRKDNPTHPGNELFPDNATLTNLVNTPPKQITILLPLQGQYGQLGQAVRDGFLSAYYEAPAKAADKGSINFIDTAQNQPISALYQQAIAQGANMIIGPLTKEQVQELTKQSNFSVPTIALNYTDLWFGSLPTNLYQFGLSPLDEAQQIADKAWSTGHLHALLIAPQSEWGQHVAKALTSRWQSLGGTMTDTLYFSAQSNLTQDIANLLRVNIKEDRAQMQAENNKTLLEQQRRQDFDVIFLLAPPQSAREIVPLLKYYYAGNVPIYSTSIIYSGIPSPQKDSDLNGILFCDTPWSFKMANTGVSKNNIRLNPLYPVGRDAYLLSNNLQRLAVLPHFPIYAASGALSLTPQQQIYRRLPWTKMHNGHP